MTPKNQSALSVRGLGKAYTIARSAERGAASTLAHRLGSVFARGQRETFWALQDVSFDVGYGEVIGIIGRNGAGKSTLLKILSRITEPTEGQVHLMGRVGSLLEVGTGFHPELTGRENILLNGVILGMKRREIDQCFDAIVDFAGVERFLETPVKRYSSGMYVRLAFAVAAHLQPEILIVDEVLAVGDAEFQRKCLLKMDEAAKQEGRTVLFVSHNMGAINRLCQRAVLLRQGKLAAIGATEEVIATYLSSERDTEGERRWERRHEAPGDEQMRLRAVRVLDSNEVVTGSVDVRHTCFLEMEYEVLEALPVVRGIMTLMTSDGTVVFTSSDSDVAEWGDGPREPGVYRSRCRIPGEFLNIGQYTLNVGADHPYFKVFFVADNVLSFQVEQTGGASSRYSERWPGVICPRFHWEVSAARDCALVP